MNGYFYSRSFKINDIFTPTGYQCCYMYGSVPHNESNCVYEGRQLSLHFIVYNPHDTLTELTVRWFRSDNITRTALSTEEIQDSNEYELLLELSSESAVDINIENCNHNRLYKDVFTLRIHNFTSEKNGYYWCQIIVNNSVSQPSQHAWFYAEDIYSCTRRSHFKIATEPQCAEFTNQESAITSEARSFTSTLEEKSFFTSGGPSTRPETDMKYLSYIIGLLVVFFLLVMSLFKPLMLLYFCKKRKKDY